MIRYRNGVVGVDVWSQPMTLRKSRQRLLEKAKRYSDEARIKEQGQTEWGPYKVNRLAVKSFYSRIRDDKVGSVYFLQPKDSTIIFRVRKVETSPPLIDTVGTSAIDKIYTAVVTRFPYAESWGICNCRPIAGTSTWSQHSWCNAWDIHADTTAQMDAIYDYLNANRNEFDIAHLLWRVADHFDHIHVDPNPLGQGTPPCAR